MCYASGEGQSISQLQRGDEIVIQAGFGAPEAEKEVTEVVVDVEGNSALTASGRCLMCLDGRGVRKTGRSIPEEEWRMTDLAKEIQARALSLALQRDLGDDIL